MTDRTTAARSSPAVVPRSALSIGVAVSGTLVAVELAVTSAQAFGNGSKMAVVLPLAIGAGIVMAGLAVTRFEAYVLIMLALRASVDLTRLSGPSAGTNESVGSRVLDPSSIFGMLFLVVGVLWLLLQRWQGPLPGCRLRLAAGIFLATGFLSVFGSEHLAAGFFGVVRIASGVVMFVVLEQLAERDGGSRRILVAVYASTVFPLGYSLVGLLGGGLRTESGAFDRALGTFNNSNTFARYLMLLVIMGVALFPHVHRGARVALGGIVGLSGLFLVLTYTRSALIGTVIGLVVVAAVQSRRVLVGLAVAGTVAVLLVPGLSGRFTELVGGGGSSEGNSFTWRLSYWSEVAGLAKQSPLTGIGVSQTQYFTDEKKQPHNDFLRAAVETGLVGLAAYIGMLVALVALGVRAVRASPRGSPGRGIGAGFTGCAAAFVAASWVANLLSDVVVLCYLFAFAAVASAVARGVGSPGTPGHQPLEP